MNVSSLSCAHSNDSSVTTLANAVTAVSTNSPAKAVAAIDTKIYEPGMKKGTKQLYSGKEDKKGRFQWQNTIPDDIGDPAENDESAQWALIIRNVKVYNDPKRVLAIHSIVVQSPLLKKLLTDVLKNYPGFTVGLKRLELSGKFEPLIHRWAELEAAIGKLGHETEEDRTTREHASLLQDVMFKEFKELIDISQDMKSKRVMTYEHLWTLFQPSSIVFAQQDGQETAMSLVETHYGVASSGSPCFWLTCRYVDWDGSKFGSNKIKLAIPAYTGTRPITSLRVYPIEFHPDGEMIRTRLTERGGKVEALAGSNYRAYQGIAWRDGPNGTKERHNVRGRIVIDTYGWNRFNPNYAINLNPLSQKDAPPNPQSADYNSEAEEEYDDPYAGCYGSDHGAYTDEEKIVEQPPLSSEQKLICKPILRGYSLKDKLWLNFFVNCVHDLSWQTDAFDHLVLPPNQKELILGFAESQRKLKDTFDDVIEGKGKGMIVLLCGPTGVGKTLTAESVAEEMRVPLYFLTAGDLGFDAGTVETQLQDILEMCTRWHAILLLDEADIFLEKRSLHELERNKLVSVFLRILEYYAGTMILTTNRVQTFDPAFQSRIHISINYPDLSMESRRTIWQKFLATSAPDHAITASQLQQLSRKELNGRQIKNILKIARLLAGQREERLGYHHLLTTMEVTQHLHNDTQLKENTRGTLYG